MIKAEPRFDLDLKYGQQGEAQLREFLGWIANGSLLVEVKRKRYLDYKIYVETHCDKGRSGVYAPSGINTTESQVWAFVVADTGIHIAIPTEILREAVNESSSRDHQALRGNCPTRGKLIDFTVLLYRLKKRLERGELTPVSISTSSGQQNCIHRPEFSKDGRCLICDPEFTAARDAERRAMLGR